jgi:hypothetical protein
MVMVKEEEIETTLVFLREREREREICDEKKLEMDIEKWL